MKILAGCRRRGMPYVVALATLVNLWIAAVPTVAVSAAGAEPLRIVAYGDSLTAGFGLNDSNSFPAQLQRKLAARGHAVEIVNAGVSGDTTGSGLERFAWAVPDGTDAVILELGANDALRGLDPAQARKNLEAVIEKLKERKIDVLLAGMVAPRNLGHAYVEAFDAIYPDLAEKHGLILYPFFLDGVAADPALNLDDGLHPNAKGIAVIVESILPKVEELIARAAGRSSQSKL